MKDIVNLTVYKLNDILTVAMAKKPITVKEVATRLGRTTSRIDQIIRELGLELDKVGNVRVLSASQIKQIALRVQHPEKPGPKGHNTAVSHLTAQVSSASRWEAR